MLQIPQINVRKELLEDHISYYHAFHESKH